MDESNLSNLWEDLPSHRLMTGEEDESEVDGVLILAKATGPAFFPDTTSGNGVYYSRQAWNNAINHPEFLQRLEDRLVLGTIGHSTVLNDEAVQQQKFSHVITKVWIDENNVGQAEYLIYNTPPGQALNMLLRTNSKIRVSTKARGKTLAKSSKREVDPNLFFLDRIDYVLDPGYRQAGATLVESLIPSDEQTGNLEENHMDNATEKLIQVLESRIEEMANEKQLATEVVDVLKSEVDSIRASSEETETRLQEMETALAAAEAKIEAYDELGEPDEISEALDKAKEQIQKFSESQDPEDKGVAELLESYKDLGTVDELKEVIESANTLADKMIQDRLSEIAESYKVSPAALTKMQDRGLSLSEIQEFVEELTVDKNGENETDLETEVDPDNVEDGDKEDSTLAESVSSRSLLRRSTKAAVKDINESRTNTAPSLASKLLRASK